MAEIQIRFIRGTALDSKLIEYRTRAWCSHVEAVDTHVDKCIHTYGAMLKGGVKHRLDSDHTYKGISRWEIWNIPCTEVQYILFWSFLLAQNGKPYDWRAIVSFSLGERDWEKKDSWFCSELMVAAGLAAGLWVLPDKAHIDRIDPGVAYLLYTILPGAHL